MKEIDDWKKPQEQMSRERRLSSPAAPWLQSLQPASHPHAADAPHHQLQTGATLH